MDQIYDFYWKMNAKKKSSVFGIKVKEKRENKPQNICSNYITLN